MKIVAARLPSWERAREVLAALRARYDLGPDDAAAAELGSTDYAAPAANAGLLVGRFRDDRLEEIEEIVHDADGEVFLTRDNGTSDPLGA